MHKVLQLSMDNIDDSESEYLTKEELADMIWLTESCEEIDFCFYPEEIGRCPLCLQPVEGASIRHKPKELLIN